MWSVSNYPFTSPEWEKKNYFAVGSLHVVILRISLDMIIVYYNTEHMNKSSQRNQLGHISKTLIQKK